MAPAPQHQTDQLIDSFESEWQANRRPRIADYVAQVPEADRPALLRELVRLDLEYRLRAGQPVRVEQYRNRYPALVGDDALTVDLLTHECRVRLDCSEPVDVTEYVKRFPALREPLSAALAAYQRGRDAVGGYQLLDELGRGGMGTVLRAIDCDIRREVAVKFLLHPGDAGQQARFLDEARITGQLEHPNIVPIHQLGTDPAGRCYFAMKLIRGRSLADLLRHPTPADTLARLLTVFLGVCNALAYAHSRRVIHRDLKPANIMIGDFGEVYVMDWGLAKPLSAPADAPAAPAPPGIDTAGAATQTQAGTVLGTPAYMPPEQARGDLHLVGERSDIYALGAILYEILTLTPPPGRGGDPLAVLKRVINGDIEPPEQRAPNRLRAGWVPPELSAVAMKALARRPDERYPSVAHLRHDVERYLENRSVSARRDSVRAVLWKFVKRNKGLSAGLTVALIVLLVSLGFLIASWRATSRAYAAYEQEQKEKETRTRRAVPALVDAARQAIARRQTDAALEHLAVALDYEPDQADALLLKGAILISRRQFPAAARDLERCARLRPDDPSIAKLARLCALPDVEQAGVPEAIGQLLVMHGQPTLALELLQPDRRLALYRKQIDDAWPGVGRSALTIDKDLRLSFRLNAAAIPRMPKERFVDLTPLAGIPISVLQLDFVDCHSLAPLRGMPLESLRLRQCRFVDDLEPLRGAPLKSLIVSESPRIKSLGPLNGMPLTVLRLYVSTPADKMPFDDLAPLRGLPLQESLMQRAAIANLKPLRGLPLRRLALRNCPGVSDLTPLEGMQIEELNINSTQVKDLNPLRGMPLTLLECGYTPVKHLDPLEGMQLTRLNTYNHVRDLTPLRGMNLESIQIPTTNLKLFHGMEILRTMKSLRQINGRDQEVFWSKLDSGELK